MSSIPIFTDLDEARRTILKRVPLDEYTVSPRVQAGIRDLFGEDLSPEEVVRRIIADVRANGDTALRKWTSQLDGADVDSLQVSPPEIQAAYDQLDAGLIEALRLAAERIRDFHSHQPITSWINSDMGGVLGQQVTPIQRVGVYAPAGSAPLPSSVLMCAIPARVAGVEQVVVCSPPQRDTGEVSPYVLAAADIAGADAVYRLGGAQAIGGLAFGTETVAKVDKLVGPGNLFVVLAKRAVYGIVGIDGIPGPTETLVIADSGANPQWAAADLLAQAEHDVLAAAIMLTTDADFADKVQAAVDDQLTRLSRADVIKESLARGGGIVIVPNQAEAVTIANEYAAEHLCLLVRNPWDWVPQIKNAGGIFIGEHSFEVLGDYVAGPSHVMPTGGTARFASPLNVLDFVKVTSLVSLNATAARDLSGTAATIADAEQLTAHAQAARFRADSD